MYLYRCYRYSKKSIILTTTCVAAQQLMWRAAAACHHFHLHHSPVSILTPQHQFTVACRHVVLFISQQLSTSMRGLWWLTSVMALRHTCYTARHCSVSQICSMIAFVWVTSLLLDFEVEPLLMGWNPASQRYRFVNFASFTCAQKWTSVMRMNCKAVSKRRRLRMLSDWRHVQC